MRYYILTLILSLVLISCLRAQEETVRPRNRAVGIVPQYAFLNGLRTDLDFRLSKGKPQWLIVSPQVFLSSDKPALWSYNNMWGLGIELQHRYYLKPENRLPEGLYFGYGPMFQYFSIDDERLYSEKVVENGIEYTIVKNGLVTTGVYKFGLTATAGYQLLIYKVVYFDFYMGAGIRLSFDNLEPSGLHKIYNDWWGDYGYSGTLLTFGLRIGMAY